jgi:hypothetical protein
MRAESGGEAKSLSSGPVPAAPADAGHTPRMINKTNLKISLFTFIEWPTFEQGGFFKTP